MRILRSCTALALSAVIALSLMGVATARPGRRVEVHAHSPLRVYDRPYHRIHGRVVVHNRSSSAVGLRCNVVVLLRGAGTKHKRGYDMVHIRVRAHSMRETHFIAKIKDAHRRFANVPASTLAHCHRV